jgi:hypothetical protein
MSSTPDSMTEKVQDKLDTLADKNVDSTDSEVRYLAYGARLRTALRAGTRYIAYVRIVGRPFVLNVAHDAWFILIFTRPATSAKLFAPSSHPR